MFNKEYSIPFFMAVSLLMNISIFPMDNQNNKDALFLDLFKNCSIGTITHDFGKTALHVAAGKGTMPLVQLLVAHNNSFLNRPDHNGLTPVMYAAWSGHADIVKYLIDQGAMANRVDNSGTSALAAAGQKGHFNCVKIILAQPDMHLTINYADLKGSTALHWASFNGHPQIVGLLLAKKADVDIKDNEGFTPLARAIQNNQTQTAELLMRFGADVSEKDKSGMAPIHWAGINGNIDSADLLLKYGADVNAQDALKKRTPLAWVICMREVSTGLNPQSTQEFEYKQNCRVKGDHMLAFVEFLLTNAYQHANISTRDAYAMAPLDNLLSHSDDTDRQEIWFKKLSQLLVESTSSKKQKRD